MSDPLSNLQIQELTVDLETLKTELLDALQLASGRAETVELDQQLTGRVSRMDAMQQQQMAKANSRQYRLQLAQVEAALKRIQSEDYGNCLSCDELISYPRLKVRPESPLCIVCQEKSEQ